MGYSRGDRGVRGSNGPGRRRSGRGQGAHARSRARPRSQSRRVPCLVATSSTPSDYRWLPDRRDFPRKRSCRPDRSDACWRGGSLVCSRDAFDTCPGGLQSRRRQRRLRVSSPPSVCATTSRWRHRRESSRAEARTCWRASPTATLSTRGSRFSFDHSAARRKSQFNDRQRQLDVPA